MTLGNYVDALLGLVLLLAIVWTLRRGRRRSTTPLGDITRDTVLDWVPFVPEVTGYGVTINDEHRRPRRAGRDPVPTAATP